MMTTVTVKSLPRGLAAALRFMGHTKRDVKITAKEITCVLGGVSQTYTAANVLVPDLDNEASIVGRRGVWGGNNGYNRAPADRTWDPVFDQDGRYPVPVGGAIVVGLIGRWIDVMVHPETFARFVAHEVARDALLEGRTDLASAILASDTPLTDEECAILYAHKAFKSGDYRKRVITRLPDALETCVTRGLIKRASNGACTITTQGKALEDTWRKRGESIAWKI